MVPEDFVPILLQQLLRSIEDHPEIKRPAITYAALILIVRLVVAQSEVLSLWFCRRCYERSRGEMITMVFEKALSRKAFGSEEDTDDSGRSTTEASSIGGDSDNVTPDSHDSRQRASTGKILNLLRQVKVLQVSNSWLMVDRNDVYDIAQRSVLHLLADYRNSFLIDFGTSKN